MKHPDKDTKHVLDEKPLVQDQSSNPSVQTNESLLQELEAVLEITGSERLDDKAKAAQSEGGKETDSEAPQLEQDRPEETQREETQREETQREETQQEETKQEEAKPAALHSEHSEKANSLSDILEASAKKFQQDIERKKPAISPQELFHQEKPTQDREPLHKVLSSVSGPDADVDQVSKDIPAVHQEVDDEHLLSELHALIGDPVRPMPVQGHTKASSADTGLPFSAPPPRPGTRITPDTLRNVPDDYENMAEADTMGVPGWLKGVFILVLSLLLCAMTFYAVASDVLCKI